MRAAKRTLRRRKKTPLNRTRSFTRTGHHNRPRALQRNDEQAPDSGIATAFRFASPGNRAATGPLERFIQLVKSPAYKPLLNHKTAARGAVRIADDIARQRVTLTAANGERIVYLFTVSKQTEDPYKIAG
jgi:hypothetical protein